LIRTAIPLITFACLIGCSGQMQQSHYVGGSRVTTTRMSYSLPKALINLSVDSDAAGKITVTTPSASLLPDPDARYNVEIRESAFADDTYNIGVSTNGLLETSQGVAEDRTSGIVAKVIEIFTEVAKMTVNRAAPVEGKKAPYHADLSFDPFNNSSVARANSQLRYAGSDFVIDVEGVSGETIGKITQVEVINAASGCSGSLCTRLVRPIVITLKSKASGFAGSYMTIVPDPTYVVGVDIERGPCIKRDTKITFANGILTKYDLTKPSEVLGCLAIPLELAKAIVSIPGALLTFRVEKIGNENKLVDAQAALLASQAKLIKAQADAAARTASTPE